MLRSGLWRAAEFAASCFVGLAAASGCSSQEPKPRYEHSGDGVTASWLSSDTRYARVAIDGLAASERDALKTYPGIQRWVEIDQQLLVLASSEAIEALTAMHSVTRLDVVPRPESLCLVHRRHDQPETLGGGTVLARSSNLIVLQADRSGGCMGVLSETSSASVRPITNSEVVARRLAGDVAKSAADRNPHTEAVVGALDMDRWQADVQTLASFDRFAMRASGIEEAKEWIAGQFCGIAQAALKPDPSDGAPGVRCKNGRMDVRTQPFALTTTAGTVKSRNVILTLQGIRADGPVFVVGAHYDSIANESGESYAPGAEDNASGASAVVEMARAIAQYPTDATFVFVAFSGEEQGMVGSKYYVQQLAGTALAQRIRGVVIMDMIGYSGDADLDCMLETSDTPEDQALISHLANIASTYAPGLSLSSSTNYWGSDHEPFLDAGYTGLLTIENDYEAYPYYHSTRDTFANQNERLKSMAGLVVRMNTAALAEWATPNTLYAVLSSISLLR